MNSNGSRYLFRAQGLAAAGDIRQPAQETIDVQAGICLPITGGKGSTRVTGFQSGMISFASAEAKVEGSSPAAGRFDTKITITIKGLKVGGVVTADKAVATLTGVCKPGKSRPSIRAIAKPFTNLRIKGKPCEVELSSKGDGKSSKTKIIRTSIHSDAAIDPIEVAGLGKIYLAEWVGMEGWQRLTLMRVELEGEKTGSLTIGEVELVGRLQGTEPAGTPPGEADKSMLKLAKIGGTGGGGSPYP